MSQNHKYAALCACGLRVEVETQKEPGMSPMFCTTCRSLLSFKPSAWDHTGEYADSMSITSVYLSKSTICIQVFDMREVTAAARFLDVIEPEDTEVPPC